MSELIAQLVDDAVFEINKMLKCISGLYYIFFISLDFWLRWLVHKAYMVSEPRSRVRILVFVIYCKIAVAPLCLRVDFLLFCLCPRVDFLFHRYT
jgi:hypothetical protein